MIINGGREEEGAVALQALGCIDFSDARRRQGVVVKTDRYSIFFISNNLKSSREHEIDSPWMR